MKEFADDNFKFDENGRKLSKQVENTVGKGEIARYTQFLLFQQCFQKACFQGASKGVIVWEWVKEEGLENIVGKEAECFNPFPNNKLQSLPNSKCLPMPILNLMKMAESSPIGWKTLWEKGEIACYEQFLLFSQCFQKACNADT